MQEQLKKIVKIFLDQMSVSEMSEMLKKIVKIVVAHNPSEHARAASEETSLMA